MLDRETNTERKEAKRSTTSAPIRSSPHPILKVNPRCVADLRCVWGNISRHTIQLPSCTPHVPAGGFQEMVSSGNPSQRLRIADGPDIIGANLFATRDVANGCGVTANSNESLQVIHRSHYLWQGVRRASFLDLTLVFSGLDMLEAQGKRDLLN